MLEADEFESAFRSADKARFRVDIPAAARVLVVTDLAGDQHTRFDVAVRHYLRVLGDAVEWQSLASSDYASIQDLLDRVAASNPDLVVTYRDLASDSWRYKRSLGSYLDVLTLDTDRPVLVVPNPHEETHLEWENVGMDSVMVATDHLVDDDRMVNWGALLTEPSGVLHLVHVEDDGVFDRYMSAISKVGEIDTDTAREVILKQLLKEPREYIASCRAALVEAGREIDVHEVIRTGHSVTDYLKLIEDNDVDLLVLRATEGGKLALHGAAYLLTMKLRQLPILML